MKNSLLYYSTGALLYCPAHNEGIVHSLVSEKFGSNFSLALCLEDTINDDFVPEAENKLVHSISLLYRYSESVQFFIPKIFIRVRNPEQITTLLERCGESAILITGFIIPKFSPENADRYIDTILEANRTYKRNIYMLPILESPSIVNLQSRPKTLYLLKEKLDTIEELVLNIRVGGNDLCHLFGFRRHNDESIHGISPIANIFSDIVTVFGMDYVISGPVWEYYNGEHWSNGLNQELRDDRLCGFIGKTIIHPNQIPLVNQAYKVTRKDYEDACSVLNWDMTSESFVSGNIFAERMNEYKTHSNWAEKILFLSKAYGIIDCEIYELHP